MAILMRSESPLDQMNFKVDIADIDLTLGVTAVRGIKKTVGNIEHRKSGSASLIKENHPGLITVEPVTLSGAVSFNLDEFKKLQEWQTARVTGSRSDEEKLNLLQDITIHPTIQYTNKNPNATHIILKACEPRDISITDFDTNSTGFIRFEMVIRPSDILFGDKKSVEEPE